MELLLGIWFGGLLVTASSVAMALSFDAGQVPPPSIKAVLGVTWRCVCWPVSLPFSWYQLLREPPG